ncbi:MAG: zf-HC2 domain-containing protein [Christensenellaceae bacterium]|nr:zf-HC2 domain-containing protein [Christensenellaceae bacterium]
MDCSRVREEIYEYMEGQMSEERAREMQEHLAACELCHTVAEEYRRMLEAAGQLCAPVPDFVTPAMAKIKSEQQRKKGAGRTGWQRRLAYGLTAAAVLVFGSVMLLKGGFVGSGKESAPMDMYADEADYAVAEDAMEDLETQRSDAPAFEAPTADVPTADAPGAAQPEPGAYEDDSCSGMHEIVLAEVTMPRKEGNALAKELEDALPGKVIYPGDGTGFDIWVREDNLQTITEIFGRHGRELHVEPGWLIGVQFE